MPLEIRVEVLDRFIARHVKAGFKIVTRTETSAELDKPSGLLAFMSPPETLYVVVDETGHLWVNRRKL